MHIKVSTYIHHSLSIHFFFMDNELDLREREPQMFKKTLSNATAKNIIITYCTYFQSNFFCILFSFVLYFNPQIIHCRICASVRLFFFFFFIERKKLPNEQCSNIKNHSEQTYSRCSLSVFFFFWPLHFGSLSKKLFKFLMHIFLICFRAHEFITNICNGILSVLVRYAFMDG